MLVLTQFVLTGCRGAAFGRKFLISPENSCPIATPLQSLKVPTQNSSGSGKGIVGMNLFDDRSNSSIGERLEIDQLNRLVAKLHDRGLEPGATESGGVPSGFAGV